MLDGRREGLRSHLRELGVSHNVYYPVPLYRQGAFAKWVPEGFTLANTELLCDQVISLPMHTELDAETLDYVVEAVRSFGG